MVLKRTLSIFLAVLMIGMTFTAFPITVNAASNTWDPVNDVYDITTEDDLFAFNEGFWTQGMYYEGIQINLMADITITEGRKWNSAPAFSDVGAAFAGIFNGNNHTISNLNMVSSDNDTVSFLPPLKNATVKDLTLKDVTLEYGYSYNAAFSCISLGDDTISNCHLIGNSTIKSDPSTISDEWCFNAGIVAYKDEGTLTIENCSVGEADNNTRINATGNGTADGSRIAGGIFAFMYHNAHVIIKSTDNYADVSSDNLAGGFIGDIYGDLPNSGICKVRVENCRNYGHVFSNETNKSSYTICGGIVAEELENSILVIDRCANHGDITVNCYSNTYASGGLCGELKCAAVLNSYNTGRVEAKSEVIALGGIVGHIRVNRGYTLPDTSFFDYYPTDYFNAIINCYNVGDVIGGQTTSVGGVCGYLQDIYAVEKRSIIKNAYNFAEISGQDPVGTVSGCNQDTMIFDVYGQSGSYALGGIEINEENISGVETCISEVGYFDTPDVTGTIYPATVKAKGAGLHTDSIVETISTTPLSGNLLYLLNEKVKEYNAELETGGSDYRYLTWKMTNPASEDGYKGEGVHPMFGVQEFDIRFYPNFSDNEKPFRTYTAADLVMGKVPVFYDLPAHDGYIFKGWYLDKDNDDDDSPISFDTIYTQSTDIYAHWIKVENVAKDENDPSILPGGETTYGGFDLAGVQIRKKMLDHNFEEVTPGGMRFITSLNMDVVNEINKIKPNNIEYGYVAATHKGWIDYHCDGVKHGSDEKLKYVSETANGIDTSSAKATNENYFGFAKNVNCTSKVTDSKNGVVRRDHQNFDKYLLYSLVITYEEEGSDQGKDVLARPYIRYTDANGLERVAYSEYTGTNVLGGCYTNYNTVAAKAGN